MEERKVFEVGEFSVTLTERLNAMVIIESDHFGNMLFPIGKLADLQCVLGEVSKSADEQIWPRRADRAPPRPTSEKECDV